MSVLAEVGRWVLDNLPTFLGFIFLAVILGLIVRGPMSRAVERSLSGLTSGIVDALSQHLKDDVLPLLRKEIVTTRKELTELAERVWEKDLKSFANEVDISDAKSLLDKGDVEGAESTLEKLYSTNPLDGKILKEYVDVLLIRKKEEKNDRIWELLQKSGANLDIDTLLIFYLRLAFSYYFVGNIDKAIDIGEAGLRLAEENIEVAGAKDNALKLKNSLAYYYAETGALKFENIARTYSEAAVAARPGESAPLDTKGFVKITFGISRNEILEGISLCEEARKLGAPFEFYAKHVNRAAERLRQITG